MYEKGVVLGGISLPVHPNVFCLIFKRQPIELKDKITFFSFIVIVIG